MKFDYDPKQTRSAVANIAALFGHRAETAKGLEDLFEMLRTMNRDALIMFAEEAVSGEIDCLCDHYHKAPDIRALVALTIVLCLRSDKRWSNIGRFTFFQRPTDAHLKRLLELWPTLKAKAPALAEAQWLMRYLSLEECPQPLAYVIEEMKMGRFPFDELNESYFRTPLFNELVDYLFAHGGALLARVQEQPAHDRVCAYLTAGDDVRVRGYLTHYPAPKWQATFLEQLYRAKGKPDSKSSPFFKQLDDGVLWGVRQQLFSARMSDSPSPKQQQAYWMDRLHRCGDWRHENGVTHIEMDPLRITEEAEITLVTHISHPDQIIARIPHGNGYTEALDKLVSSYLGW